MRTPSGPDLSPPTRRRACPTCRSILAAAVVAAGAFGSWSGFPHRLWADGSAVTLKDLEPSTTHHRKSREWRDLPTQSWEYMEISHLSQLEPVKMDNHLQRDTQIQFLTELPAMVTATKLRDLGDVISAPSPRELLGDGDHVIIDGEKSMAVGQTYTVSQPPTPLEGMDNSVRGYVYHLLGELKITNRREEYWEGVVLHVRGEIERGSILLPAQPKVDPFTPAVAGPATLYGLFMVDHDAATSMSAQFGYGFVDLGAADGIKTGMIFQSFQYRDDMLDKRITSQDAFPRPICRSSRYPSASAPCGSSRATPRSRKTPRSAC